MFLLTCSTLKVKHFQKSANFAAKLTRTLLSSNMSSRLLPTTSCCLKYFELSSLERISLSRTSSRCLTSSRLPRNSEIAFNTSSSLFTHLRSVTGGDPRNCNSKSIVKVWVVLRKLRTESFLNRERSSFKHLTSKLVIQRKFCRLTKIRIIKVFNHFSSPSQPEFRIFETVVLTSTRIVCS